MHAVKPRFLRPRLLLLPLVFGALAAPALLTTSAIPTTADDVHAGTVCSNVEKRPEPAATRDAPTCINCRAPLLNAPVAQAGDVPARAAGTPQPAA